MSPVNQLLEVTFSTPCHNKLTLLEGERITETANLFVFPTIEAGLIHSQENQDFVGVVPPCRPRPTHDLLGVFGIGATTGDCPYRE